jgi:hypothetical protein
MMNAADILKYGHLTVVQAVEGLAAADWTTPGVCGWWSVKDIMAHLTSFEHLLIDVLKSVQGEGPTPTLAKYGQGQQQFNDLEVEARQRLSSEQVWAEYNDTFAQAAELLAAIPVNRRRLNGVLPWYGSEYDLEDFIVYTFYGHKREHSAQIAVFRDQLKSAVRRK